MVSFPSQIVSEYKTMLLCKLHYST